MDLFYVVSLIKLEIIKEPCIALNKESLNTLILILIFSCVNIKNKF
jgi:hypothetical protein